MAENTRQRKPRNGFANTDPTPPENPSNSQPIRCKPTISSLLLSTENPNSKNKYLKFRGLGCTAPARVSVPEVIRSSADWDGGKRVKKKKHKKGKQVVNNLDDQNIGSFSTSCLVVPDVWCGPGIGFSTDAANVDCVVSRRPGPSRGKVDGERINFRERSTCTTRRTLNRDDISFFDTDAEMSNPQYQSFGSRHDRHVRHRSPDGFAEIVMLQTSLLMGERSGGLDRYRDWRLDVDSMSYEELLELGDKIGYVNTGLKEDDIVRCLRRTKLSVPSHFSSGMQWKCSICQEEFEGEDEMGKLDCGHFYHISCIKQWLGQKKTCPVCKTSVLSTQ